MIEINATWLIRWEKGSDPDRPRIQWIGVEDFEVVTLNDHAGPLFVDYSDAVLANNHS